MKTTGFRAIAIRSLAETARRPIYWVGIFVMPLIFFLFLTSLMGAGLPTKVPAGIVDKDGTHLSRQVTQTLGGMQMVDLVQSPGSYTEARHAVQRGEIYGFFMIPENFQADVLAGRAPVITFYTNMTYYVPASLLFKTFKATAVYTKAGIAVSVLQSAGAGGDANASALLQPINIAARGIGNPWLDYGIYLCNSFVPCVLQLMILLITCFTLGHEVKNGTSRQLLRMANGSIFRAVTAKLLPQTVIWTVIAFFMEVWLFKFNHYPMHGSWGWLTLSQVMFVLASQGLGVFFYSVLPNLRLSLSISALVGILSFSIAAFSFPVESMYGGLGIFSWILPIRYNFLIYIDQALNGREIYYSRIWYVAYIIFMLLPLTMLWNLKRAYRRQVYVP